MADAAYGGPFNRWEFQTSIRALIERVIHYERSRLILLAAACWAVATITCVLLGVHL
jgi:hypothetical protein